MKKLVEKLIVLFESEDRGIGYEPLIIEFVDNEILTEKERESRIAKIKGYYQKILSTSKSVRVAYEATRKWANRIF